MNITKPFQGWTHRLTQPGNGFNFVTATRYLVLQLLDKGHYVGISFSMVPYFATEGLNKIPFNQRQNSIHASQESHNVLQDHDLSSL